MKDVNVKHVVIVGIVFAAIVIVTLTGSDSTAIIVVGMAVLGGLGLIAAQAAGTAKETQIVREQTNGTNTRLVEIIEWQARLLAQMNLPPELIGKLGTSTPAGEATPVEVDERTAVLPAVELPPGGYPSQYPGGNTRAA